MSATPSQHSTSTPGAHRWLSYNQVLRKRFGRRVYKIGLDAGFTCPNIDGTLARGGCTYCHNAGFSPGTRSGLRSVGAQIELARVLLRRRYGAEAFIAYFQAFTNTYGRSAEALRRMYDDALSYDGIVGLAVGTRPDCVPDDVLALLASYRDDFDVTLELGLQTIHDGTQERVNRWHTFAQFEDAFARARAHGLQVCVHLMLGLPGETRADMLATAAAVGALEPEAVKIHLTHVLKGTVMAHQYARGEISLLAFDAYVEVAADVLERMPPATAIQRLTGEAPHGMLVAPAWANEKQRCLDAIDGALARRGTCQGSLCPVGVG